MKNMDIIIEKYLSENERIKEMQEKIKKLQLHKKMMPAQKNNEHESLSTARRKLNKEIAELQAQIEEIREKNKRKVK